MLQEIHLTTNCPSAMGISHLFQKSPQDWSPFLIAQSFRLLESTQLMALLEDAISCAVVLVAMAGLVLLHLPQGYLGVHLQKEPQTSRPP